MTTTLLHFDPGAGASGDMVLGALLDVGVPPEVVDRAVRAVGVDARLEVSDEKRHGVRGKKVRFVDARGVPVDPLETGATGAEVPPLVVRKAERKPGDLLRTRPHDEHQHHAWKEIRARIRGSALASEVRDLALAILERLARAEAEVHGIDVEEVAFHEVAAADSLGDMVGAAAAIRHLQPHRITCDAFGVCGGSIKMEHGVLPAPAPATGLLLRGAPVIGLSGRMETVTPTGAAILTTVAQGYGPPPAMTLRAQGHGLGKKDPPERANLLRLWLGEAGRREEKEPPADVILVETNVDDSTPQWMAHALSACLEAGALDAWVTPVVMKKGRPGWTLSALVEPAAREPVTAVILRQTSTLGVRYRGASRSVASRRVVEVETPGGKVRVKVATWDGQDVHATPEHDDCVAAARAAGLTPARIHALALAAWELSQKAGGA
ncbi:MAG: nickel pincer cofactor biosynthesis protein LarC [Myxococcota bacterium]